MSTATATAPVTAAQVRTYFRGNEAKMESLSPEARATVAEGARGTLHREAVKVFNKGRRDHRRYVVGNSKVAKAAKASQREALMNQGLAGSRGPLSKAARAAAKAL